GLGYTAAMTDAPGPIGRKILRREDRRFLTGTARYIDDLPIAGALHARFVRSPHAHAGILGIDADAARALPGVVAIVTGGELAQWTQPLRLAPAIEGLHPVTVETLPTAKVRFHGDPVACIVATSRAAADDAAELVRVDYEPLPAVTGMAAALAPGAPRVDDALPDNLVSHQSVVCGDPQRRFAEAHRVVEARFVQHRQTHVPMEPRGCCAVWDEGRRHLTMHVGTQVPHPYRTMLSARLGLSESQITVLCPDIGGGFGQKITLYREELTVAALARALNRPVRWREDRGENLMASAHAREQTAEVRAAVDADGRIAALDLRIIEDFGAYCFYPANYLLRMTVLSLTGPYRITDYAYDMKVVLSNKCGAAPMRAPMSMASWVMDGTIEAVARELGLDPIDVRRRNMLHPGELPWTMPAGPVLEDVTLRETFEAALEAFDVPGFRARQAADRARGVYRGMGVCCVVESNTYGSAFYRSAGIPGSGHEAGWVKVAPTGAVDVSVGLMASGQGYETALAQAAAEGLGVPIDSVRVHLGNTDVAPYGMGSRGARGGTAGSSVLLLAGQTLQRKMCAIAASLLGLNSGDELRLWEGRVQRVLEGDWQDAGLGLLDIARVAYMDPLRLPEGVEPGLEAHRAYDPPPLTFSNATHACEVVVDAETGAVQVERWIVAEDCGRVLNPAIVAGQQHGAVALGIAGVLQEQVVYDATGQNVTGSFMDYAMPVAATIPPVTLIPMHTPSKRTLSGTKGMSEGGVMGAVGALPSAVADALAPFGVVVDRQPLTAAAVLGMIAAMRNV
ncbi:MAG TPA: xanthine dehydrogenase family protein molybdopterin-binding subunit, partial [Acetobacteraceae bacterium]|nr:xanthine dehydrogenase family protein molybdopterin-binding subunit [Acetobacteraceae bacterium]